MPSQYHCVSPAALPTESAIARAYESMHLVDAYSINLPISTTTNPELLARFIFSQQASWVKGLMKVRDLLVAGFGLKTSAQLTRPGSGSNTKPKRVGIFKIYSTTEHEIVLGEDDKHLDFRLSVLCSARPTPADGYRLVLSTVVHCHNRLGRLYILLIAPFHRQVVQSCLRRAARVGWPRAEVA